MSSVPERKLTCRSMKADGDHPKCSCASSTGVSAKTRPTSGHPNASTIAHGHLESGSSRNGIPV